ncbi:MAG: TlpA family protein disulfide reductase [Defluviitaleaceae bacterium]|nr:TlpA family protein disulfide reductase [Defluviitaleaceae bacterium]
MYKKAAILCGVIAFIVLIIAAAITYDWLVNRAEDPDNLIIHDPNTGTIIWGTEGLETPPPQDNTPDEPYGYEEYDENDINDGEEYEPVAQNDELMAPDFAMYGIDGNQVRLSDFFGKPIVLNFWTTWCPACVTETPYFQQLYEEVGSDVHILKVSLGEAPEHVGNFIASGGYDFPVFIDEGDGAALYNVARIPMTFFINAEGHTVASMLGSANEDTLLRGLEEAGFSW